MTFDMRDIITQQDVYDKAEKLHAESIPESSKTVSDLSEIIQNIWYKQALKRLKEERNSRRNV